MKISNLAVVVLSAELLLAAGCPSRPAEPKVAPSEPPVVATEPARAPNNAPPSDAPPAAADNMPADSADHASTAWQKDGAPAGDTESRKSKDGFGAQLFLTEDEKFFEDWNKPETPHLKQASKARRDVPLFTVILFVEPGVDDAGKAKVNSRVIVRKPDGTVYGEADVVGWDREYAFPANSLQLGQDRMGIRIEPQDPAGTYTVEATVHDEVKQVELKLTTSFEVVE
jgi:hypothetical protein